MIAWHYLSWWAYAEIQREMLAAESLVRDRTSDVAEIASAAVFALACRYLLETDGISTRPLACVYGGGAEGGAP